MMPAVPERVLREAWIAYKIAQGAVFANKTTRGMALRWWHLHGDVYAPPFRAAAAVLLAWERARKGGR